MEPKLAQMALAGVARRHMVRPMVKMTKANLSSEQPLETVWRKREVQHCQSQPVSFWFHVQSCSSCVFAKIVFWQFRVRTVATAMNTTGSVDTTPTCTRAYAHFSRAHLTRDDCTCGSRASRLKIDQCCAFLKALSSLHHVFVRCVLSLVSLLLLHLRPVLCHDPPQTKKTVERMWILVSTRSQSRGRVGGDFVAGRCETRHNTIHT